jgi:hypothetical protein
MSLDLYERETAERLSGMSLTDTIEPSIWDGFGRGTGMTMMRRFAQTGSAIDLALKAPAIALFQMTDNERALEHLFRDHDKRWGSAVEYWTPQPNEVGVAGQVAGEVLAMIPSIIAAPATSVGAFGLSTAEDLVKQGVEPAKAGAVGVTMGAGLGAGVLAPILGRNLWQRMIIGGAGFNVVQGAAMRGLASEILEDTPAKDMFHALDSTEMAIDLILGLAFGGMVHFSPEGRAQGERAWAKLSEWAQGLTPTQVSAIMALRQAKHAHVDTLPGKPDGPEDLNAHVERLKTATEQILREQPVNVQEIKVPEESGAQRPPQFEPVPERIQEAEKRGTMMLEEVNRALAEAGEDGMPIVKIDIDEQGQPFLVDVVSGEAIRPDENVLTEGKIERLVRQQIEASGRFADDPEYRTQAAKLMQVYYEAMGRRMGMSPEEVYALRPVRVTGEAPSGETVLQQERTIQVDGGARRPITDSTGKPVGRTFKEQQNFWRWAKDTKVVDEKGRPRVLYHGTADDIVPAFDLDHPNRKDTGWLGTGVYMTTDRALAGSYSLLKAGRGAPNVLPLYVRLENPYYATIKDKQRIQLITHNQGAEAGRRAADEWTAELKAKGHDGVILQYREPEVGKGSVSDEVVAFDPKAVKSAIGNRGTFDPESDNILFQAGKPWYYSELAKQIEALKQERAPAEQWKGVIKNLKGVKPEEIEWTGIMEWLDIKGGRLTKAEILDYLGGNGVKIEETIYGHDPKRPGAQPVERTPQDPEIEEAVEFLRSEGFHIESDPGMPGRWGIIDPDPDTGLIYADIEEFNETIRQLTPEERDTWHFNNSTQRAAAEVLEYLNSGEARPAPDLETLTDRLSNLGWSTRTDGRNVYFRAEAGPNRGIELNAMEISNDRRVQDPEIIELANDIADMVEADAEGRAPGRGRPPKFAGYIQPFTTAPEYFELTLRLPEIPQKPQPEPQMRTVEQMKAEGLRVTKNKYNEYTDQTEYSIRDNDGFAGARSGLRGRHTDDEILQIFERSQFERPKDKPPTFRQSHHDEDNIVAHIRGDTRIDAEGKRVLMVQEFQSDWAQKGKRQGFSGDGPKITIVQEGEMWLVRDADGVNLNFGRTREEAERWAEAHRRERMGNIPRAPFVTNTESWTRLALKRMIVWAAENGYDRIAWTRGEQQVERYTSALRKAVDEIEWKKTDKGIQLKGYKQPDRGASGQRLVTDEQINSAEETVRTLATELEQIQDRLAAQSGGYRVLLGGEPEVISDPTKVSEVTGDMFDPLPEGAQVYLYKAGWIYRNPNGEWDVIAAQSESHFAPDQLAEAERAFFQEWAQFEYPEWREHATRNRTYVDHEDVLGQYQAAERARAEMWRRRREQGTPEKTVVVDTTQREDELSDAVGKAIAKQIIEDPAPEGVVKGDNLKIDDTGMAGYYDRMLPSIAKDIIKKYGGKLRTVEIDVPSTTGDFPKFRPFTEMDQMAFAGAEGFNDGSAPVKASARMMIDGRAENVDVLVSRSGVEMYTSDGEIGIRFPGPELSVQHYAVWEDSAEKALHLLEREWREPQQSFWANYDVVIGEARSVRPATSERSPQTGFDITPEMRKTALKGLPLFQKGERGLFQLGEDGTPATIGLLENADRSTFIHEAGHFFLETTMALGRRRDAPPELKADIDKLFKWWGVKRSEWDSLSFEERRPYHEQFARGFERYLAEGRAPVPQLQSLFERMKAWLREVYQTLTQLGVKLSDDVRGVMGRMLGAEPEPVRIAPAAPGGPEKSLLQTIKDKGGIQQSAMEDITGEKRFGKGIKGVPWGLFKLDGNGLDDLADRLRAEGWPIPEDPVDGGVQALKDMIREEIEGGPAVKRLDEDQVTVEEVQEAAAEDIFQRYAELEAKLAEELKGDGQEYRNAVKRLHNERDNALAEVFSTEGDAISAEARRFTAEHPDEMLTLGEETGEPITKSAREYLDEAEREYLDTIEDTDRIYREAAECLLGAD